MKLTINENIRKYRKSLNLTQEQLAEAMGVTVGAVSKWESGQSNPDISMLPVLADFFEISVDVLLGYQVICRTAQMAADAIDRLILEKSYEEGKRECEKSLQKFPNSFSVVYRSAVFFHVIGAERKNPEMINKAIELYRHACSLLEQNTMPNVSELTIQISIGELYLCLNEVDKGIEHLKKYNYDGISNDMIGYTLTQAERCREAESYLSDALIKNMTKLYRTGIGLANCYVERKDEKTALELLLWIKELLHGAKCQEKISYLDRLEAVLLSACAQMAVSLKKEKQAEAYLKEARKLAHAFDEKPNYDIRDMKFYLGEKKIIGDNFGEKVMESIENLLASDEKTRAVLTEIWRRFDEEEKQGGS